MLHPAEQAALVSRLNRIEADIRGLRRMVQEPHVTTEILRKLATAEGALSKLSRSVLRFHVESCVPEGVAHGKTESRKSLDELVDIFDMFAR